LFQEEDSDQEPSNASQKNLTNKTTNTDIEDGDSENKSSGHSTSSTVDESEVGGSISDSDPPPPSAISSPRDSTMVLGNRLGGNGWSGWSSQFEEQKEEDPEDVKTPCNADDENAKSFDSLLQLYGNKTDRLSSKESSVEVSGNVDKSSTTEDSKVDERNTSKSVIKVSYVLSKV